MKHCGAVALTRRIYLVLSRTARSLLTSHALAFAPILRVPRAEAPRDEIAMLQVRRQIPGPGTSIKLTLDAEGACTKALAEVRGLRNSSAICEPLCKVCSGSIESAPKLQYPSATKNAPGANR